MVCDGEIQLILGPMFSGKSTELLRRIRRYSIAKQRCMVVKYKNDTRYSKEALSTHDRVTFDAVPADALAPLREASLSYDVIGVDEGQFFPDIVEFAESLANLGKVVVISALDGTFQRKPFGRILDLVPFAEHVTKLNAVCAITCREAAFSKRTTSDTAIEVIGGNDMYIPVSRAAFLASSAEEAERHPAAYGSIELILGPMFSGKSTELLRRIRRHSVAKRRCLVLKYKKDTRYSQKMVTTHDMQSAEALPCDDLFAQADACEDYDVIGIDEGQFFNGVDEFAEQMANQGKTVVIAALDGTFQRRPFGSILEVIPYAERVTKLSAVCAITQKDAAFTMRTTMQQEVEVIGGSEMYLPVSRSAFFEPVPTGSKRRSPGKRGG